MAANREDIKGHQDNDDSIRVS